MALSREAPFPYEAEEMKLTNGSERGCAEASEAARRWQLRSLNLLWVTQ